MDERINQVEFREKEHEYWYNDGRRLIQLHGVTGPIGKLMGKNFPDNIARIELSAIYGHDVHHESEMWIKKGTEPSTESGKWLVEYLKEFARKYNITHFHAELKVSDFVATASCIDIVAHSDEGDFLFDIKTTSKFDREYCSLQLSVYKTLYERNYERTVKGMFVLGTTPRRAFRIINQPETKVEKILRMNKEN